MRHLLFITLLFLLTTNTHAQDEIDIQQPEMQSLDFNLQLMENDQKELIATGALKKIDDRSTKSEKCMLAKLTEKRVLEKKF